jgi:N-methylhydantoinase B
VIRIIEKNTRQPVEVIGDLRAQIAACRRGERGPDRDPRAVRARSRAAGYLEELQTLSERLMRAELAALPDGVYSRSRTSSTGSATSPSRCGSRSS